MVYMYHSFLIHSSADGHLGCFHVLAIKNICFKSKSLSIQVYLQMKNFTDLISFKSYVTQIKTDVSWDSATAEPD